MSFVIAADEDRVADAIARHLGKTGAPQPTGEAEDPSHLYLHKIVQTTIPVPALSRFDTQAFLLLLQLQQSLDGNGVTGILDQCTKIRRAGGALDDIKIPEGTDVTDEITFASRLTPILYEKLHGNPRRIKRFLNDLRVRQSIAERRGIMLDSAIVAKLMVLEKLLDDDFKTLLGWLAQGSLRDQLKALESAAGRPATAAVTTEAETNDEAKPAKTNSAETKDEARTVKAIDSEAKAAEEGPKGRRRAALTSVPADGGGDFSEGLLRWAKLTPPLSGQDLSPYLFLAAAFAGAPLLDEGLPERLRDIAANLLSRRDQRAVTDEDLAALPAGEAEELLKHLGRTIRDQRGKQGEGIIAILRIAKAQPDRAAAAAKALAMLPPEELRPGTALLFVGQQPAEIAAVIERWESASGRGDVIEALRRAREKGKA